MLAGHFEAGDLLNIPSATTGTIELIYTIQPDDSLTSITESINDAAGVTVDQIINANPGVDPTKLQIGQVILIPSSGAMNEESAETGSPILVTNQVVGYWDWTWDHTPALPDANLGIAFSGWADVSTALEQSFGLKDSLVGSPFICLGGGNENGAFTADRLSAIQQAIKTESFEGYSGIAFDVEEGDAGLEEDFANTFKAAQAAGYEVLVTVSHSAPFGISDGASLMSSFFSDQNIDILSPQLYTTGNEKENDYATSHNVAWSEYAAAKATIAPSIVTAGLYDDAVVYFQKQGVTLNGYIQWSRSGGSVS